MPLAPAHQAETHGTDPDMSAGKLSSSLYSIRVVIVQRTVCSRFSFGLLPSVVGMPEASSPAVAAVDDGRCHAYARTQLIRDADGSYFFLLWLPYQTQHNTHDPTAAGEMHVERICSPVAENAFRELVCCALPFMYAEYRMAVILLLPNLFHFHVRSCNL